CGQGRGLEGEQLCVRPHRYHGHDRRVEPGLPGAVLRCGDGELGQRVPDVQREDRAVSAERSDWVEWRNQYLCLCGWESSQSYLFLRAICFADHEIRCGHGDTRGLLTKVSKHEDRQHLW